MAAVHGVLVQRASSRSRRGLPVGPSICEVYVNAPARLASPSGRLAWSCLFAGAVVEFQTVERDDVDVKYEVDYETAAPFVRFDSRNDPARLEEMAAMTRAALADGKLAVKGKATNVAPDETGSMHDIVARFTS
jgi:hypothetical protein